MSDLNNRKCVECGYLSVRSGGFPEVNEDARDDYQYAVQPCCFVRQRQMGAEVRDVPENEPIETRLPYFNKIIKRERICAEFREWDQGFSPKEHVEMGIRERAEARGRLQDRLQYLEFLTVVILASIGFYFQWQTAKLQADATMNASKPQAVSEPSKSERVGHAAGW